MTKHQFRSLLCSRDTFASCKTVADVELRLSELVDGYRLLYVLKAITPVQFADLFLTALSYSEEAKENLSVKEVF